jgi:hypothetical protein
MYKPLVALLVILPLAVSAQLTPYLIGRQSGCGSDVVCGDGCMPVGASCCSANGDYCPSDQYCTSLGCCDVGSECSGPAAGTTTVDTPTAATNTAPANGGSTHKNGANSLPLNDNLYALGMLIAVGNLLI